MASPVSARVGNLQIEATPNKKAKDGVAETAAAVLSLAKGSADGLGVVAKASELAGKLVSSEFEPLTAHWAKNAAAARNWLALTYLPTVLNNLVKKPDVRKATEAGKITLFSGACLVPCHTTAKQLAQGGTALGTLLDGMDFATELEMHGACSKLLGDTTQIKLNPEVKKIVDNQLWNSTWKIFKLALTLITGLAATIAWAFSLAIPVHVATALLVASLGALCISLGLSYGELKSEWTAKVSILPPAAPAVGSV